MVDVFVVLLVNFFSLPSLCGKYKCNCGTRGFSGYLYQNFISAVIFVGFTHPYSIGDRVVIDDGIPMYVTRIKTYTTEFENIYGVQVIR